MSKFNNWALAKFLRLKHRDDEAQGLAEYGLILALIAVVCIAALTALGTGVAGKLDAITAVL